MLINSILAITLRIPTGCNIAESNQQLGESVVCAFDQECTTGSRRIIVCAAVYAILVLLLYGATQSTIIVGHDGMAYLQAIETGNNLFNPHHWLFNAINHWVYLPASMVGLSANIVVVLHNMLWVIATAVCTQILIIRLTGDFAAAVVAALFVIFANVSWYFSLQYEVYPAANGSLALLVVAAVYSKTMTRTFRCITLAALLSLAVLYYQGNVLFVIPLSMIYFWQTKDLGGLACILAGAGTFVLTCYLIGYYFVEPNQWGSGTILEYIFLYLRNESWGRIDHFGIKGAKQFYAAVLRNYLRCTGHTLRITNIVFLALITISGWGWVMRAVKRADQDKTLILSIATWCAIFCLFFWWWTPGSSEVRAIAALPIHILLFIGLDTTYKMVCSRIKVLGPRGRETIRYAVHLLFLSIVAIGNWQLMWALRNGNALIVD